MPVEMNDVGAAVGELNTRFQLTGQELEDLTEYFLQYANINNTSVSSSIKNVSGIMKAFQEDTANTGKVLDALSDVGQRTGKDINSLESELLSNSATFKELGLDIRQSVLPIDRLDGCRFFAGLVGPGSPEESEGGFSLPYLVLPERVGQCNLP